MASDAERLGDAAEAYQRARRAAGEEIPLREAIRRVSRGETGHSFSDPDARPAGRSRKAASLVSLLGTARDWVESRFGAEAAERAIPRGDLATARRSILRTTTDATDTTAIELADAAKGLTESAASLGYTMTMWEAIQAVCACPVAFAEAAPSAEIQVVMPPYEVPVSSQEAARLAAKYPKSQPFFGAPPVAWEARHRALVANVERFRVAARVQAAGAIAAGGSPDLNAVRAALDGESDVTELARLAIEIREKEGVSFDDAARAALRRREPETTVYLDTIPPFSHVAPATKATA